MAPYNDKMTQRVYQRKWMASRRKTWFEQNGPCVKCGSWERLHIHHKDPANKVTHNVWSWTEIKRVIELAKCEVLCQKCHLGLHALERQRHGRQGYKRGCRCEECVTAFRERKKRYYRNRRAREFLAKQTAMQ